MFSNFNQLGELKIVVRIEESNYLIEIPGSQSTIPITYRELFELISRRKFIRLNPEENYGFSYLEFL